MCICEIIFCELNLYVDLKQKQKHKVEKDCMNLGYVFVSRVYETYSAGCG